MSYTVQVWLEQMSVREAYEESWRWLRNGERAWKSRDETFIKNAMDWLGWYATYRPDEFCAALKSHTDRRFS